MLGPAQRNTPVVLPGLYVGMVQKVEDLELGQIQVSIPTIFEQSAPENWAVARPCFPYGHFFVPQVGDKVWLAFENGNLTAPVWLGIWYPEGSVPSEADTSPPVKRVIRSASGHLIILDDTEGSEALILKDKSGNSIEMRQSEMLIKCMTNLTIDASDHQVVIKANSVDVQQA